MPLDLEEQEQLANLKAFWINYGRWLALGIAIALVGYAGYWFYQKHQENVSLEAAKEYEELLVANAKSDFPVVEKKALDIETKYEKTTYAVMAGLVTANLAYSINDLEKAKGQLQWVEEKSNSKSFQTLARLRLVALLMDQKEDSALLKADELLKKSVAPGYEPLHLERQGDLLLLRNKPDEAKKLYLQAWDYLDNQKAKQSGMKELDPMTKEFEKRNPSEGQRLLKIKIDSLGGF